MYQIYNIIFLILFVINIILNIFILYKLYHIKINITLMSQENINDINDKKLYDTIKPIENSTFNNLEKIKINNIDFSTKKDILYYYQNKPF